jgi:hypothetical protein
MSLERWGRKVEKEEQVKRVLVILGIEVRKRLDRTKKKPRGVPRGRNDLRVSLAIV